MLDANKKGKAVPQLTNGGAGVERMCSSYSFTTSALDWVSDQRHTTAALYPRGEDRPVPIVLEAGWAPGPVWAQRLEENLLHLPGIESRSPGPPVRSQTLY
jgi:hypothetical protein